MYLLHRSVGPSVQFLYSGCMIAAKFRIMTIEQRAVRGTAENFVICDTQKSYSENLFRRLSEKLSGYFQFHVFHDIENLKIAAKSMQVNILLIGEEYGKEDRDEIPARQKYLLIGEKIPNERIRYDIESILQQYEEEAKNRKEKSKEEKIREESKREKDRIEMEENQNIEVQENSYYSKSGGNYAVMEEKRYGPIKKFAKRFKSGKWGEWEDLITEADDYE